MNSIIAHCIRCIYGCAYISQGLETQLTGQNNFAPLDIQESKMTHLALPNYKYICRMITIK